jgi:pSer/pThr/pTyr-binding forkhead associated (FHA) protein
MSLKKLYAYVHEARTLSRESFLDRHRCPVLVIEPFSQISQEDTTRFETLPGGVPGPTGSPMVGELSKRPGANAFSQMIMIGRARNNDLTIPGYGISKFHGYVMFTSKGATLTDAGSTNGTFLKEEKLRPLVKAELNPGDELQLGSIKATYHTPETFHEYLHEVIADPSQLVESFGRGENEE